MAKKLKLKEILSMTGGVLKGNPELSINSITSIDKYKVGSISPLWESKFVPLATSKMVLLTKPGWIPEGASGVEVEDPRRALVFLLEYFDSFIIEKPFVSKSALVSGHSTIGENVYIGPNSVVSEGSVLSDDAVLLGNVWIGKHVTIGKNTIIEQGVVIHDFVTIGENCIIHSNAVIGSDGFGFMPDGEKGLLRIPQIGNVVVEDNVEIGSCSCIDKATFGETLISKGTKIDSLVKVGHNCRIGANCILVSQSGIAGSTILEEGVTIAAQVGIANHATIGARTTIGARAGVIKDVPKDIIYSGFPAQEHREELRQQVALRTLPKLIKEIKELKEKIEGLTQKDD